MTTSTTQDFGETMDRQYAQALMTQLAELMDRNDYYLIKQEHLEALLWFRNDQVQMMMKETDGGKA